MKEIKSNNVMEENQNEQKFRYKLSRRKNIMLCRQAEIP